MAALPLAVALLSTAATATSDPSQYVPSRIRGASRFHTAANIATQAFDQADVAHLATGTSYPDALAGSFAAGSVDGPLLLSAPDRLPRPTREALATLSVERVVIIGGTAAISQNVADELADAGYATDRVDGANRFQTASSVARRYGRQQVGTVDGQRVAILATGAHFADALAAGPIAASARVPLLLTPRDRPADSVTTALGRLDIDKILLLGGSQAISPDVAGFYRDRGYDVERIGGPTLMDTAGLVADTAIADFNFTPQQVLLARGDAYPDALAASVYGATTGSPVMLSATSTELSGPTSQWLTRHCPDVGWVTALGGVNAISQDVRPQAVDAANACQEVAAEESAVALTADGQVAVVDTTTGKPLRQLMSVPTDDWANNDLAVTPDRRTAFVTRPGSAEQPTDIARVPVSGGEPEIVATDASSPAVSPDGETLAYIVHRYPQPGDPDPRIVLRDLSSGQQVMLDSGGDWHYVSELAWTADGERLAFVSGEVMTGVATIDADATSMAQASQVGPPLDGSADRRWTSVAGFEQGLAVVDRCCDLAQPRQWRVLHAGLDGTIHGTLIADGRLEATRVTSNADGSALLAVVDGGPDGGQLVRWNGAGQAHTVTGDVIEAAW